MARRCDCSADSGSGGLPAGSAPCVYTVGHSTLPIGDFLGIIQAHGIEQVVDVRRMPRSRTNPQFNQDELSRSLAEAGIGYHHLEALGGLRRARPDSPNTGWRNASFRGYADYMLTDTFRRALDELIALAAARCTAIMCAEAVPWRCHRSLIADALVAQGLRVYDLIGTTCRPHALSPMARLQPDGSIVYQAV